MASAAELSKAEEIDLTSMIDVTFLLIIFFLVVTELSDASKEKLTLPLAERALDDVHEPGRLIININKKGEVKINKKDYDVPALNEVLDLERRVSWDPVQKCPTRAILVRVDGETRYVKVFEVMALCMKQQLWKIAFAAKAPRGD
ncbi:MAG: ExbD/TolR family protein [Planctomycetota bacterium]|jgi:biopolymer transport protein ExbD